jgi:hypothetical protein
LALLVKIRAGPNDDKLKFQSMKSSAPLSVATLLVIATAVHGFLPGASPVPRLCRSESLISDAFRCQRRSAGAVTPFMALSGGEKVSQSINTIVGVVSIRV